ncbi:MAG TPA: MerR family transcriptional regulator [bacterium (Candidatus Stahlbacteria)]|nr:MerR family transcriptional regulator [Candidatus Stahlbacteria bacterium]
MDYDKKLYFSISEVSKITGVKPYVLRFWESEFGKLRPRKNRGGRRLYTQKDVKLILAIKKLLYEDGYSIAGAKKQLENTKKVEKASINEGVIQEIKKGLEEVLELLSRGVAQSG